MLLESSIVDLKCCLISRECIYVHADATTKLLKLDLECLIYYNTISCSLFHSFKLSSDGCQVIKCDIKLAYVCSDPHK